MAFLSAAQAQKIKLFLAGLIEQNVGSSASEREKIDLNYIIRTLRFENFVNSLNTTIGQELSEADLNAIEYAYSGSDPDKQNQNQAAVVVPPLFAYVHNQLGQLFGENIIQLALSTARKQTVEYNHIFDLYAEQPAITPTVYKTTLKSKLITAGLIVGGILLGALIVTTLVLSGPLAPLTAAIGGGIAAGIVSATGATVSAAAITAFGMSVLCLGASLILGAVGGLTSLIFRRKQVVTAENNANGMTPDEPASGFTSGAGGMAATMAGLGVTSAAAPAPALNVSSVQPPSRPNITNYNKSYLGTEVATPTSGGLIYDDKQSDADGRTLGYK